MEEKAHQREIYEGYVRAAGACIQRPTIEAMQEYGAHSALAAYFVPDEIRQNILQLEKNISSGKASLDLLAAITEQMRNMPAKR